MKLQQRVGFGTTNRPHGIKNWRISKVRLIRMPRNTANPSRAGDIAEGMLQLRPVLQLVKAG